MTGEPHGCPRRHFLALALTPLTGACQQPREPSMDGGMPHGMPNWMMGPDGMMDPDMMRDMQVIHDLLAYHQDIRRTVQDLSYVRATTTSGCSDVAERIRAHVEQMRSRLDRGAPIRQMDPLFAEIFERAHEVELEIEHVPGGVRVDETSRDPVT